EILAFPLTPGNTSDVSVADILSKGITGNLYGDKGYISEKLGKKFMDRGLQLFTNLKSKMKNTFMNLRNKVLLRKRAIIETVNDQRKNISQIEYTRHRSISNFLVNTLCAIAAYMRQPKKPCIKMSDKESLKLVVC
ncbi:MAG: IS982 family transposase, partial [Chlamydiae bacterium]